MFVFSNVSDDNSVFTSSRNTFVGILSLFYFSTFISCWHDRNQALLICMGKVDLMLLVAISPSNDRQFYPFKKLPGMAACWFMRTCLVPLLFPGELDGKGGRADSTSSVELHIGQHIICN